MSVNYSVVVNERDKYVVLPGSYSAPGQHHTSVGLAYFVAGFDTYAEAQKRRDFEADFNNAEDLS